VTAQRGHVYYQARWAAMLPALRANLETAGRAYAVAAAVPASLLRAVLRCTHTPSQLYAAIDPRLAPRTEIPPWVHVDANGWPTRSLVDGWRPLGGVYQAVRTPDVDHLEVAIDAACEQGLDPTAARVVLDAMWSAHRLHRWEPR
jgi:hypothetical protein